MLWLWYAREHGDVRFLSVTCGVNDPQHVERIVPHVTHHETLLQKSLTPSDSDSITATLFSKTRSIYYAIVDHPTSMVRKARRSFTS